MLPITQELIDSIHLKDRTGLSPALARSYMHTILKCGSHDDAAALLTTFLEKPSDYDRTQLLPVIAKFGSTAMAQQLLDSCVQNNRLKADMPEDVLHTLGQLRSEAAFETLLFYALDATSDYYTSKSAVLGLLHFSCVGYEQPIEAAIRSTFGKTFFNEFVPSLVCKLPNRNELFETMYEHGSGICSTDCNAGILLGFALGGAEGAAYFKRALFDPCWETASTATGTVYWSSKGMEYAGVRFQDLFATVQQETNEEKLSYQLDVIQSLLHARLRSVKEPLFLQNSQKESLAAIYESLFGWRTPNDRDNILDLADKVGLENDYHTLENLLLAKVEEELLLRCVNC